MRAAPSSVALDGQDHASGGQLALDFSHLVDALRVRHPLRAGGFAPSTSASKSFASKGISKEGISKEGISSNSLRRGGTTQLALAGVPESFIQAHGRWASLEYRRYINFLDSALQRRPTAMLLAAQLAAEA